MILRIILWLVATATAAEVVAFVLSSIASGNEWLLALAFAPAVAIIIIGVLRRSTSLLPRIVTLFPSGRYARPSAEPPKATKQKPDDSVVRIKADIKADVLAVGTR